MSQDPQMARYMRKMHKDKGYDDEQEDEDKDFSQNPSKAINNFSKKVVTKNLQEQVEYFGHAIEPFNMRQQEEMGDINEDGFFLFKRKNPYKDAWLNSVQEEEDYEVADKLRKKIKLEGRFRTVHEADTNLNQKYQEDEKSEQDSHSQQQSHSNSKKQEDKLSEMELKQLICGFLPDNITVNRYMKQLKKEKNDAIYDKFVFLCSQLIQLTGDHDIFTKKKEDLESECEEEQESAKQLKWDEQIEEKQVKQPKEPKAAQDDEDNIF